MAVKNQIHTDKFSAYNGDCIEVMPDLPSESVGLTIYSPPFSELYNYSSSDRDLSNNVSYEEFLVHYEFVIKEIARLTMPGRMSLVHCMDLKKDSRGSSRDFPGDIIRMYERHGFNYFGRHTIWKEPLRQAVRTRMLKLRHGQLVKDSALCGVAGGDYLLVFKKIGENKFPIEHPKGLTTYAGENQPPADLVLKYSESKDPSTNKLSHYIWQRYASCVWMDIRAGRLLPYKPAKEKDEEKHICPLQLDVIERGLTLYSNPGDVVLTPFMGVGSEVFGAVQLGRKGIGIELKETYYNQAVRNLEYAEQNPELSNHDLFTMAAKERGDYTVESMIKNGSRLVEEDCSCYDDTENGLYFDSDHVCHKTSIKKIKNENTFKPSELVSEKLKAIGYDGLVSTVDGCSCAIGNIMHNYPEACGDLSQCKFAKFKKEKIDGKMQNVLVPESEVTK